MKKILISKEKNFYKANLHCHSTISDAAKTPQELKEIYSAHGYSVLAYTDHDIMLDHSDLTDDNFLALNGYELEINAPGEWVSGSKTCHMCFIAISPENTKQVCYHRTEYLFGNAPKYRELIKYDESKPDFVREYTPECINKMFSEGRKNGFFTVYNHPAWSLETKDQYCNYHGMHAMEIFNYSCWHKGFTDYNEQVYDEMLRNGEKIFCISADDNHNWDNDSFGGFTVINAEKLEYETITGALVDGNFYASQGPQIFEVWYENGKIGIECSDAASVVLNTGVRHCEAVRAEEQGGPITSAVFEIDNDDNYVRLTVTDFSGKHANTNAYFLKDLM